MFFDGGYGLLKVAVSAIAGYAALIVALRVTGKRTLSKMNAFDLVITVALGSTFATLVLSRDTPLVEGVLALALFVGLQYVVAWCAWRWPRFEAAVKSTPALVYYRGQFLTDALRRERLTEAEVRAAVRERGFGSMATIEAVVLETAGAVSVIDHLEPGVANLEGVENGRPASTHH